MATAVEMRPLGMGELLDGAITLYRRHFATFVAATLVVVVPLQLATLLVSLSADDGNDRNLSAAEIGGFTVTMVFTFILGPLATAACFKAIRDGVLGERPDWRQSLRYALSRLRSLIWLQILTVLALLPAFIALVLPGIWLSIAWQVSVPALLFEGVRGRAALGRSFRLVRDRWWSTFGVLIVSYLFLGLVGGAVGLAFAAITIPLDAGSTASAIAGAIANVVANGLATPFIAAVITLLYFDLRVRKEGFDLELMAERLGTPDAAAGRPAAPSWQPDAPAAVERSAFEAPEDHDDPPVAPHHRPPE